MTGDTGSTHVGTIVAPLATVTAQQLHDEPLGDIAWYQQHLIPVGAFVVLYGSPKAGKTTLAMHMAAGLAGAMPFLEGTGVCDILWLDLEQPRRVLQARTREVHAHVAVGRFDLYQGAAPMLSELLATIDLRKPNIVFVDSLSRWLRLESENDNAELNRVLGPILTAFQARDITLVVIHHDRKSEGTGGRNLRGASSLLAMCDCAIEVKVEGDVNSTRRRLSIVSRHEGQRTMMVRLTDAGFVDDGAAMPRYDEEILVACAGGPRTGKDLAVLVNVTLKTLTPFLDSLVERGKLSRSGEGRAYDPFMYAAPTLGFPRNSESPSEPGKTRTLSLPLGGKRVRDTDDPAEKVA